MLQLLAQPRLMAAPGAAAPPLAPNLFQRLVRTWDAVHPYNAAQVLHVSGSADFSAINRAWHQALAAVGLGRIRECDLGFHHEILNGQADAHPVRLLPADSSLEAHLSDAMNQPFLPHEPPFRPFVLPMSSIGGAHRRGEQHCFGLVYQHWIADSVSIRFLLREWSARLFDLSLCNPSPPRFERLGYWDLYGRRGRARIDQALFALARAHMRFRTVRKVQLPPGRNHAVRVLLRPFPPAMIDELRARMRRQGATVGDALQAALAMACHELVPLQIKRSRRDLAIGNIVDLRPQAQRDLSNAFGFFLGFTHVVCRRQDLTDFSRLVQSIRRQNLARRRQGIAQHTLASLMAGLIADKLGRPGNCYRLYRKEIPLAAGLSNVNLQGLWPERLSPDPLLEYIRVSPTGPMTPLVLTTTTLGSSMQLALTWRLGLFDDRHAPRLLDRVIEVVSR